MADKDVGEEDELINDTLDDEREERKQEKEERKKQVDSVVDKARQADDILKQAGHDVSTPLKESASKALSEAAPAIGTALAAIIIVIVAIGLIAFILNVPGFMRQKFNETVEGIVATVKESIYGTNNNLEGTEIDKEDRLRLLNYISSDLGFDVVGFGFVPLAIYDDTNSDGEASENAGKQKIIDYETKLGYFDNTSKGIFAKFKKNKEESGSNPDADLMYYYLMANERAYTINDDGNLAAQLGLVGLVSTNPIYSAFTPLASSLIFGHENAWTGMMHVSEGTDENGILKNSVQKLTIKSEIDRENKLLKVAINNPSFQKGLLNKDMFAFKLDGWSGRYGMPLEFSLALHIATMSSGLVKEMITNENLQTQVFIEMLKLTCDIKFKIILENGMVFDLPYKEPSGADADDIIDKIDNNVKLEEGDLSVRGLVKASEKTIPANSLPEEDILNYPGISRHMQTIDALLGSNYFVVQTGNDLQDEYVNPDRVLLVYKMDTLSDSGNDFGDEFVGKYSIATGAYVCSIDSSGNIDDSTGKLGASIYTTDIDGEFASNYAMYYKYVGDDTYGFRYKVFTRGIGGTTEYEMDGEQYIPKEPYDNVYLDFGGKHKNFQTVKGLRGYRNISGSDIEDKLINMAGYEKEAYMAMFKEVDWFMTVIDYSKMKYDNPKTNEGFLTPGGDTGDPNSYQFYSKVFNEVCDLVDNEEMESAIDKINEIMDRLQYDSYYLHNIANNNTTTYKKKVNRALRDAGFDDLDIDTILEINELYTGSKDLKEGEVEFAQPYITEVTRHWYRDVIFSGNENFETVYEKTKEPFTLKYTGEDLKKVQVEAILTPKNPNDMDEDYYYEQKEQPYVIKGDTVYKDGLKEQEIDPNSRMKSTHDEDYYYGDGYRTTKKLFTQGFYYTFDGSDATAKSIFWQQQLEKMKGQSVVVTVINGKIYNVSGNTALYLDNKTENIASDGDSENKNPAMPGVVSYIGSIKPRFDEETGKLIRGGGANYLLNVPDMEYLSPANHDYSEVEERANYINKVWEAMGVTCYRQHVSFDNIAVTDENGDEVQTSGQVIANTGLSILKNCQTKDADYIYRDLKEMLIDLGYYTQAEFDQLDVKLKWFIPRYNPKQFPQNTTADLTFAAVLNPREEGDEEADKNKVRSTKNPSGTGKASEASGSSQFIPFGGSTIAQSNVFIEKEKEKNGEGSGSSTNSTDENAPNNNDNKNENSTQPVELDPTIQQLVTNSKDKGFRPDLQVIAPGACTVTDVDGNTIEIQFDGFAQPSISAFHNYKMTIVGIEPNVAVGAQLAEGDEIGRTGTEQIKVFLKNDIGRIISNVSDYMSPRRGGNQPYDFTDDEIILLAYVINHEAAPEGLQWQMQYEIDRGYIVSYETAWDAALAFAEAVGYVLTNRTLQNFGGHGTTIQEQTTAPGQYDGSFTIDFAVAHQNAISAGSMEAALTVAEFDCDYILKPDDPNITMSRDVTGESAWTFGHEVFWWLDFEGAYREGNDVGGRDRNGEMDMYAPCGPKPYPTSANWPWDGFLTYTN